MGLVRANCWGIKRDFADEWGQIAMAYHELSLPPTLPADLMELVRKQLEPQLTDIHAMLRLPIQGDPGLQGGCNLAIAQVLLSIVGGASVTLYEPGALTRRGDRTRLFKAILTNHYPWQDESHISGALLRADAADKLYDLFRNPLTHSLGVIDPQESATFERWWFSRLLCRGSNRGDRKGRSAAA
jgi:hypothetical protein